MKKNFKKIFGLTMMIFMLSTTFVFASEFELTVSNAEEFGIFTLIPPIVAILLAFITKNVVISLFIGVLSGGFILNLTGFNVFGALTQAFLDFIKNADTFM